jgi:hypothetical protein
VQENEALRLHYNAANVTAVPSREDNVAITSMEVQSCGRLDNAFNVGGLPDIIVMERRASVDCGGYGRLGQCGCASSFSSPEGSLPDPLAREHALTTGSPQVVSQRYCDVYLEAVNDHR